MTTFTLTKFQTLTTGSDGGHNYISSEINHKGRQRKLTVFFASKSDEQKLKSVTTITVKGKLVDEGLEQSLLLLDTILI